MEKICVAVRVRPPVKSEEDFSSNGTHWKVDDNRISLHRSLSGTPLPPALSYTFDHVFDQTCSNSSVYDLLTKDIIHAVVDGFNGTAFAYGQTSSGKTFTMNGSENDPGIIHRAVKDIFAKIDMSTDREFLIRVSYMEIYNEEINDLFAVENQKLQIHESLERGIFVAGLREEIVNSSEQVLKLIEMGEVNRHFGETNMNVRSSRSHTIFRMVIESKGKDSSTSLDDAIRVSVLNLVDLAGSERIAKTGADGVRLKEGKHINKSLMILGNVINKLSEGAKQRGHIPYRDSKLTRILQPALGGNAKTSIICTVAPEEVHVEETKGTLQFANRAKHITNCVQVNEILTDAALLKEERKSHRMKNGSANTSFALLDSEGISTQDCSIDNHKEVESLRMQLQQAIDERNEFERQHKEQIVLNNQLMEEISKLQKQASIFQEIPHKLNKSLANCKALNEDIFSTFQDCILEIASWKIEMSDEIKLIGERYKSLEQELDTNNHLLEASKARIDGLEKESRILLEERDDLLLTVSDSSTRIASLNERNKTVLEEIQVNEKLNFVERLVEIMDRKIKILKQSQIPTVKVRWSAKRGPEFTWEREDQMKQKYPRLFTN